MDIEKAKNILNHYLEMEEFDSAGDFLIAIDVVLSELEKKDKVINEMAKRLSYVEDLKLDVCMYCKEDCRIPRNEGDWIKTDCIIEYFNKVEREGK